MATAAFFFAIGLLGFIPGLTTDHHQLTFAGEHSHAVLFGVFAVSVLQNLVHLAFALAGVALARSLGCARRYLIGGGFVYLALVVVGRLTNLDGATDLTVASPWLNLGIAVAMITVGVMASHGRSDHTWHFGAGEGAQPRSIR